MVIGVLFFFRSVDAEGLLRYVLVSGGVEKNYSIFIAYLDLTGAVFTFCERSVADSNKDG